MQKRLPLLIFGLFSFVGTFIIGNALFHATNLRWSAFIPGMLLVAVMKGLIAFIRVTKINQLNELTGALMELIIYFTLEICGVIMIVLSNGIGKFNFEFCFGVLLFGSLATAGAFVFGVFAAMVKDMECSKEEM